MLENGTHIYSVERCETAQVGPIPKRKGNPISAALSLSLSRLNLILRDLKERGKGAPVQCSFFFTVARYLIHLRAIQSLSCCIHRQVMSNETWLWCHLTSPIPLSLSPRLLLTSLYFAIFLIYLHWRGQKKKFRFFIKNVGVVFFLFDLCKLDFLYIYYGMNGIRKISTLYVCK